jgi:hypothetical protein
VLVKYKCVTRNCCPRTWGRIALNYVKELCFMLRHDVTYRLDCYFTRMRATLYADLSIAFALPVFYIYQNNLLVWRLHAFDRL